MNFQPVRKGYAKVINNGSRIMFSGIPVMGRDRMGNLFEKPLVLYSDAPDWFKLLVRTIRNEDASVFVSVIGGVGDIEMAVTNALSKEDTVENIRWGRDGVGNPVIDKKLAEEAASYIASKFGLSLKMHLWTPRRHEAIAVNDKTGEEFIIKHASIVGRISNMINEEKISLHRAADLYIRVFPVSEI